MDIFRGFGDWIDQPLSKSDEMKTQLKLWRDAEKNEQWYDAPPRVKVEVSRNFKEWGLCHVKIEFTIGLPPQETYYILTNPDNKPSFRAIKGGALLKNISRKVKSKDKRSGEAVEAKKELSWNFFLLSGTIPLDLYFIEDRRDLALHYEKNTYTNKNAMEFMEIFMGLFKVEPIYVDSKRLCNDSEPKSPEEYAKCSNGQGRIASKVKMDQFFKPSFLLNLPPISWYIRWVTIETTKTLIEDLQAQGALVRRA